MFFKNFKSKSKLYKYFFLSFSLLFLVCSILFVIYFKFFFKIIYPNPDNRKEHSNYTLLKLPSKLIKITPDYLGYAQAKYDVLKNINLGYSNDKLIDLRIINTGGDIGIGLSNKLNYHSLFNDTTFTSIRFKIDKDNYIYQLNLEREEQHINKEFLKYIFKNLTQTYGVDYKIYEKKIDMIEYDLAKYEEKNKVSKDKRIAVVWISYTNFWNTKANVVVFEFDVKDTLVTDAASQGNDLNFSMSLNFYLEEEPYENYSKLNFNNNYFYKWNHAVGYTAKKLGLED